MKTLLAESSVYVPKSLEQEYASDHRMQLTRHLNGAIVLQSTETTKESAYADIAANYRGVGSLLDPKGKEGLHHFLEHIVVTWALQKSQEYYGVEFNAKTGETIMNLLVRGTANHKVPGFGIWPVLPEILSTMMDPLGHVGNLTQILDIEREVIMGERLEDYAEHKQKVDQAIMNAIFAPGNPILTDIHGTRESLREITVDDLVNAATNIYHPSRLVLSVFNEGSWITNEKIIGVFEKHITDQKSSKNLPPEVDPNLYDRINHNFIPGLTLEEDTGLANELVTANFIWLFKMPTYSEKTIALSQMMPLIKSSVHQIARSEGLGYTAGADIGTSGENYRACVVHIVTSKSKYKESGMKTVLKSQVQNRLRGLLENGRLKFLADQMKLKQKAVPLGKHDRSVLAARGLVHRGLMIDAGKAKKANALVELQDYHFLLEQMLDIEPLTLIVGDLS